MGVSAIFVNLKLIQRKEKLKGKEKKSVKARNNSMMIRMDIDLFATLDTNINLIIRSLWVVGGQNLDKEKDKGFKEVWVLNMPSFELVPPP